MLYKSVSLVKKVAENGNLKVSVFPSFGSFTVLLETDGRIGRELGQTNKMFGDPMQAREYGENLKMRLLRKWNISA